MQEMRLQVDAVFVERTDSLLLGHELGYAMLQDGARLSIVGSGNRLRFTLGGVDGYVDVLLQEVAEAALAVLRTRSVDGYPRPTLRLVVEGGDDGEEG